MHALDSFDVRVAQELPPGSLEALSRLSLRLAGHPVVAPAVVFAVAVARWFGDAEVTLALVAHEESADGTRVSTGPGVSLRVDDTLAGVLHQVSGRLGLRSRPAGRAFGSAR